MHLLAELMDNAANFSPPINEVHVYVEEGSAGIVVTIEDSGLKMAEAAMRRAEKAVGGQLTDLASLQGTRLGLAVVGRLAVKYGINVSYRPSARGGTGVVVLLSPQLLAQQRDLALREAPRRPAAVVAPAPNAARTAPTTPAPAPDVTPRPAAEERPAARPEPLGQGGRRRSPGTTPNGLPVRAPGRTKAEAERERGQRQSSREAPAGVPPEQGPPRGAGARFGAFHRALQSGSGTAAPDTPPGPEPEPPAAP